MDTSPPEDFMRPELFPSVSTPVCPAHPLSMDTCTRRHTSGHPECEDQQEAFDRISGILSTLLQEASNAIKEEYSDMLPFNAAGTPSTLKSRQLSRLPRRVMLHERNSSTSTLSSYEPLSPASSVATLINDDDDNDDSTIVGEEDDLLLSRTRKQDQPVVTPPLASPSIHRKRLSLHHQQTPTMLLLPTRRFSAPPRRRDPLAESYKRLDSSMAVVESLSRDLALESKEDGAAEQQQQQQDPQSALRLTALLILPFLHIPHALVTTIFDSLSTSDSKNFAGVLAWGLFFALANIMVNQVIRPKSLTAMVTKEPSSAATASTPPLSPATTTEPMRLSSPGSVMNHHQPTIYRRRRVFRRPSVYRTKLIVPPSSPTSAVLVRSRTQPGESLKRQQQHPTLLSLRSPQQQEHQPILKRRNSF